MEDFNLDDFEKEIREFLYGDMEVPNEDLDKAIDRTSISPLTYEELKAKIIPGYTYVLDAGDGIQMYTGKGGVLEMIEAFERRNLPATLAQASIRVAIGRDIYPLRTLILKPKDNAKL